MDKVLDYLHANHERFVHELIEYVSFPSISSQARHKPDLKRCADWILAQAGAMGLKPRLFPTAGHPVLVLRTPNQRPGKRPHYLVYGHYDVQPPDPLDLWDTPPFEPVIRKGNLYGRGASDNKGQNFAHLKAVEAYLKTGTPLPCDITFVLEGEEEVGSQNLAPFLRKHKQELRCDGVVVSDTGMPGPRYPALTYGLRGVTALEVEISGPSRDLHSGMYGGSVENPGMALCQMLAKLRDKKGRITVPGLYDDVARLSRHERREFARLPVEEEAYRRSLGVPALYGEKDFTFLEQRAARPTLEINGLTCGYQGEGSKTIIPSKASAKLTLRLVPHQDPAKIQRLVTKHLKSLCPPSVRLKVTPGHSGSPYQVSPDGPFAQAGLNALRQAFNREPVLLREGGSIPIVVDFKKILGADTLLLGLALPDDNLHSPNEKFSLANFAKGMEMSAHLWQELGTIRP